MHSLRQQLIMTVASIGMAAGMVGYAAAQDNPSSGATNRPANERMEKGNKAETPQRNKVNNTMGQAQDNQRGGAAQKATGAEPEGAQKTGQSADQNDQNKRDQTRSGQNQMQKSDQGESQKTGQGQGKGDTQMRGAQGEPGKGDADTRTGQDQQRNHDVDTRMGQGERDQRDGGTAETERDRNGPRPGMSVRVNGDLHISDEKATRISESLRNSGHRENVNVDVRVGAPLPANVRPAPLPPDVVEVAPEYRGYDYVVANDEIIFIQPETHIVVGTIEAGGATAQIDTGQQIARAKPCPVD
jgi:hypothetical protein